MSQYKISGNFPTVSVTNGSATVTVLGVNAVADIDVGDSFLVNGAYSGRYDVGARSYSAPNTIVTLTAPYVGATNPAAIGVFHRDFTSGLNLPLPYDGDLEFAALNRRQMELIDQFFQNPVWTSTIKAQIGSTVSILAGADSTGTNLTNSTTKVGRICLPHYLNAEEAVTLIQGNSQAAISQVAIGGGSSINNAATEVAIYTAANNTTTTGTRRCYWNSAGRMLVGEPTDDTISLAQFNGRVKATNFATGISTNIADDGVINFLSPSTFGIILVIGTNYSNKNAILWLRPNSGGAQATVIVGGALVAVTTGILSGTTGVDGNLTVSAHTDGRVYIENRTGAGTGVSYTILSMA